MAIVPHAALPIVRHRLPCRTAASRSGGAEISCFGRSVFNWRDTESAR